MSLILIWDIKMHLQANGHYRVVIRNEQGQVKGTGLTPYDAYHRAEIQLVLKPALEWMKP